MSRLYSLCIVTVCVFPTLLGADESTDAPPPKLAVLLIDGQNNHDWVNTTPLLKKALEYSSLFVVDIATTPTKSEDFSSFQPNFSRYDVVVSNYNGTAWPKAAREAFVKYVNSGGTFGANPLRQTIGLGRSERVERLEIFWPTSGEIQVFETVPLDAFLQIVEGQKHFVHLQLQPFRFAQRRPGE